MRTKSLNRVLLTGDTVGGVWTFTLELAAGLVECGTEVLLASFGPSVSEAQRRQASSIRGLTWVHHPSKLEWMDQPWAEIAAAYQWLLGILNDFRPDIVHLNTLCHGDLPCQVPVIQTVHSCVSSWYGAVHGASLPQQWRQYKTRVEHSLRSVTLITAPSRAILGQVAKCYRVDTSDALAIYNGRKPETFRSTQKKELILSVGRLWDEAKNIRALAEIATKLEWPVYLAGNSVSPFDAEITFPNCHLLGELDTPRLVDWYGQASIYVLPARYEPFGFSALEAAMSGCALVLGDIPSLREIWKDAAVYVSPHDVSALQGAINRLIANPSYRDQMALRAGKRSSCFSQTRMVSSYRRAYQLASERLTLLERRQACAS